MYPSTRFKLIWRTLDFGTKFSQKNMNEKKIEKIYVCTKCQTIWRISVFATKFAQKTLNTLVWSIRTNAT